MDRSYGFVQYAVSLTAGWKMSKFLKNKFYFNEIYSHQFRKASEKNLCQIYIVWSSDELFGL